MEMIKTNRSRLFFLILFFALSGSCTGFAESARNGALEEEDSGYSAAGVLFESMVEIFEEETAGVDVAVESHFSVVSYYETLEDHRRQRFVGRVVPLGRGVGVRITGQVQHSYQEDGELRWEELPRESILSLVEPEELRIARRVERRYHEKERARRRGR